MWHLLTLLLSPPLAQKQHTHPVLHPAPCLRIKGADTGGDLAAAHQLFLAARTSAAICRQGVHFRAMPPGLGAGKGTGTAAAP